MAVSAKFLKPEISMKWLHSENIKKKKELGAVMLISERLLKTNLKYLLDMKLDM